jgi:hypothetical protein
MITGFLIREGVFCVSKAMDLFLLFHKKGLVLSRNHHRFCPEYFPRMRHAEGLATC